MSHDLGVVEVVRKTGEEPFYQNGQAFGFNVLSFWQWSASDLLSNATRGILAEFLVARALESTVKARAEWDAYDAVTARGTRVEVKSAAYLQSWHQEKHARITFDTRSTRAWDATTNLLSEERKRQADVYVFCLLDHKDQVTVDPLDLAQWKFFVVSTKRLNAELGEQKSLSLKRLQKLRLEPTYYGSLKEAVERAVEKSL
ncbi:hypothetical protein BH24DEI2_BH24DEI2_11410 [soil metagenome]